VVHSESKRKGNLLLFGDFIVVAMNPWFDSESGHHYLKNPAYGWVFAFLYPLRIEFSLLSGNSDFFP
ncbi:hypothetical protein, partial [Enterobacter hormaechei]|uniref:hypothetical protein n=1 Tax=Enterobacter hormaechei TaxID=158836 RepID=UPI001E2F3DE2